MNPGDRNAPLSPVSLGGSEWSFAKVPVNEDGHYPNRGNLASPPSSGGSPDTMSMNGFLNSPKSAGGPSPPSSVGRSSNGTNMYARNDAPRGGPRPDADESLLAQHYHALKALVMARDSNNPQPLNKARDKLQHFSPVQFYELSTDIFDELMRRQAVARTPPSAPNPPPAFLVPEKTFHPKRNQARQRLSSLGHPRFRDLAADVFFELEQRYPHFTAGDIPRAGSSMSNRTMPMNHTGPPGNGSMFPPRGESRMRRPSEASSSGRGGPTSADPYGDYARPMPRQPNQNKTIVPNKSTMIEEDDESVDTFNPDDSTMIRESKRMSTMTSTTDKKLIEDYESQVRELREKLDLMEDTMKKRQDELASALDHERSRATAADSEKQAWLDERAMMESKLNEAQDLSDTLKRELNRVREDHDQETTELRNQIRQSMSQSLAGDAGEDLKRENEKLRYSLHQQQQATEEVRSEAQECLREMRILSERSALTYEKQIEMENMVSQLEDEVRDWKHRYSQTRTQLRNMKGSSLGPTMGDFDVARHIRDRGFTDERGLVNDVHVTKFQIAIDELLRRARQDAPDDVVDAMKSVVVSVRRITRDIDESAPHGGDPNQRAKLRARVSATANSLITTSKNFAASAGITPVLLVDAAASHLTVAVVDLLRAVKIRLTPVAELEDEKGEGEDEDGAGQGKDKDGDDAEGEGDEDVTPIDLDARFPPSKTSTQGHHPADDQLPPPPPPPPQPAFQGRGDVRASIESSAYSPVDSLRAPMHDDSNGLGISSKETGYENHVSGQANASHGYAVHQSDNSLEDLKIYLGDQNAVLVSSIQNLVNCVRSEASISQTTAEIEAISMVVDRMISETLANGYGDATMRLTASRDRLLDASQYGKEMSATGWSAAADCDWRSWMQSLPPMAFEIARDSRELAQGIGKAAPSRDADDFS